MKATIKGWQPETDFNVNYSNNYMEGLCPELLETMKRVSKYDVLIDKNKKQTGTIKSLPINVSTFSLIFNQIEIAKRYMVEMVWCLKTMGFDIKIQKILWRNIMDSSENITGTIGFFQIEFTYKKS